MKSFIQFILLSSLFVMACKPAPVSDGKYFGKKIDQINAIDFNTLLSQIETQDSVYTQLEASVKGVCQVKGCWMNLVDETTSPDQTIFVKFKDYAFFMPKDIAGKKVIVEGYAYKEVTSVDELRHYAEDEGKSQEEINKITEPQEEFKFMADGVIIL